MFKKFSDRTFNSDATAKRIVCICQVPSRFHITHMFCSTAVCRSKNGPWREEEGGYRPVCSVALLCCASLYMRSS